jgi:hypothetical protein
MATTYKIAVFAEDTTTKVGHLEAVDPSSAGGIGLPAFRPVTGTPPTGNVIGEAIIDRNTHLSYVWDGLTWAAIVPPSIVPYDTDAAVLADTVAAAGVYAFSKASGNLWVRYDSGGGTLVWRPIGPRVYPTQAGLLSDAPSDGVAGLANDTKAVFYRVNGAWVPGSWVRDTEAHIAALTSVDGQQAFSSDTKKIFFADGSGGWDTLPWKEYATEAAMFADTPPTGTLAVALDTGHVAYWVVNKPPLASTWMVINGTVAVLISETEPTGASDGALWYKPSTQEFKLREAGKFKEVGGSGVKTGSEPAAAVRKAGTLWWTAGRLWIWDGAGVWVEI